MTPSDKCDSGSRLERALEIFLSEPVVTAEHATRVMLDHPDLCDLLEPMLAGSVGVDEPGEERVLGDYRLVRELGRGGMGIVYEAWQRSLDRRVAVKVLSPGLVPSAQAIARFRREASAAGRLHHKNIVEVLGFGSDRGQHFFAMQLVVGESLASCMGQFRNPEAAVDLIAQLLDALAHAHIHGLVHRDVKPGNVIIAADGTPMLTDFGIASDDLQPTLTREGGFLGTLDYASPEQVRGEVVDARTDVWAVGVVLYELLSDVHPFAAATQQATLHNVLNIDPPPLNRARVGDVSSDLAAVVARAIEKDRTRRYVSAHAMLADLCALQQGVAVSVRLPSTGERMVRWARREPWRAAVAVLICIGVPLLAGSLGYLWANQPRIEAAARAEVTRSREELLAQASAAAADDDAARGLAILATVPGADDVDVAVSRALLLFQLQRREDAVLALRSVAGETVELMHQFLGDASFSLKGLSDARGDAFDCYLRAKMLLALAKVEGAADKEGLRVALELAMRSVTLSPSPRLNFLITWADAAYHANDPVAARVAEGALATHFPGSPAARMRRAVDLTSSDPEQALNLLQDATLHGANEKTFWVNRGVALERLRKWDEAEASHRRAIAIDPDYAVAWANLGVVLRKRKQLVAAETATRRAIELSPRTCTYYNYLALTLRAQGRSADAVAALDKALELQPQYAAAHGNLGNLLLAEGNLEAAATAFRNAVKYDPSDVKWVANLGHTLGLLGQKEEALPFHMQATRLAPNDLIPFVNLATTARELGLARISLEAAERARTLDKTGSYGCEVYAEALLAQKHVDAANALAAAREADARAKGNDLRLRILLARALEAHGERPAAIDVLEAAAQDQRFANHKSLANLATLLAAMRASN